MKRSKMLSLLFSLALGLTACAGSQPAATTAAPATAAPTTAAPATTAAAATETAAAEKKEEAKPAETTAAAKADASYPANTITCIVPFAPGGGNDTLSRAMISSLDVPVSMVVQNIEGAGGLIGAQEAYRASNDGYTILSHNPPNLISQTLSGASDVELFKELELICFLANDDYVIVVSPTAPYQTLEELIEYAKAHPGELTWGATGATSIAMADSIRTAKALGCEFTMVPYDGGAAGRTALLGGHVNVLTSTSSDIRALVDSGEVTPLFICGMERNAFYPEVPTLQEKGFDIYTTTPRAYYAPPGTDEAVLDYLESKMKDLSEDKEFIEFVENLGYQVNFVGREDGQKAVEGWYDALVPIYDSFK